MDDVGQRILRAASDLLEEGGPASVSTRAIAARAGTTTMGIVSRFASKAGVIDALYSEGFDRLRLALSEGSPAGDPVSEVQRLAVIYRTTANANPGHFQVMFGHPFPEFEPSPEAAADAVRAFDVVISASSRLLAELGSDRAPSETAFEIWAAVHGVTALEHSHLVSPGLAERLNRSIVGDLIAGIG